MCIKLVHDPRPVSHDGFEGNAECIRNPPYWFCRSL
jgi:hypothetical protein